MRTGDPAARNLPTTPGGMAPQPSGNANMQPVTPPGPTQPGTPKPSDAGQRTGDPGAREQPTNPRPRS